MLTLKRWFNFFLKNNLKKKLILSVTYSVLLNYADVLKTTIYAAYVYVDVCMSLCVFIIIYVIYNYNILLYNIY